MTFKSTAIVAAALGLLFAGSATAADLCKGYGPQTPRDISVKKGLNERLFALAPSSSKLNLCNIHLHKNAEHKARGFVVFAGASDDGGYQCNGTKDLTDAEKAEVAGSSFKGVTPGQSVEVHWVFTSCDVAPGPGLGSCLSEACANPQLRVEAQTFLVVNDPNAPSIMDYGYPGKKTGDYQQPKSLPTGTGDPVVFLGSTTGPSYTEAKCSPLQVTWSVRPDCMKVSMQSLNTWAESGNVFDEKKAHGVRQLVTAPELLSPIE